MRRAKRPSKINATAKHYFDTPVTYRSSDRLVSWFTANTKKLTQRELAGYFGDQFHPNTTFLPDTCFITGPKLSGAVWSAILQRKVCLTQLVKRELSGWLLDPHRHQQAWSALMSDQYGPGNFAWFDSSRYWPEEHRFGIGYYVNLLGERKRFARTLALKLREELGREPTQSELNHVFQKGRSPRDLLVYPPAERELRLGGNVFTDEELVVTACAHGLRSGHDSVILTRDRGVFDQFAKLSSLLTWHYLAMRFSEALAAYPRSFETKPMPTGVPEIDAYFVAENSLLVRKPGALEDFVDWLIPPEPDVVRLQCVLLGGEGDATSFDHCVFEAERDLDRIIRMKGRTRGGNTDLLQGRNCHITGYPRGIESPREYVAVVQDREVYAEDGNYKFPQLELTHAVQHFDVLGEPKTRQTEHGIYLCTAINAEQD